MDQRFNALWDMITAEICNPMKHRFATDCNGAMISLYVCGTPKAWRTQFLKLQAQTWVRERN